MTGIFVRIYDFLRTRSVLRRSLLAAIVALLAFASSQMDFKEDIGDFLPTDERNADVNWAFTHLNNANRIAVTLTAENDGEDSHYMLMDAADTLVALIGRIVPQEYIARVVGRIESDSVADVTSFILKNLPLYMTDFQYLRLDSLLAQPSLDSQLMEDRAIVASPLAGMMQDIVASDPLLLSAERLRSIERFKLNDSFRMEDDYIFTGDGSLLVTIDLAFGGSDTMKGGRLIASLDEAMRLCEDSFDAKVKANALGSIYIASTNASQLKRDSVLSIIIAVVLIASILTGFFRRGRSIFLVCVTISFGFLTAFGCTALICKSISLIVIGMGAVIIGIAANYPLHFISHIKQGFSARESLYDIVRPLTTGNITTIGAFLSLLFLSSPAMRDLGLFAALLLAGTILFTLVFLPHLVREEDKSGAGLPSWGGISSARLEKNRAVIIAIALVTLVLSFFDGVRFETDLHNINYMTSRQRENMGRMLSLVQGGNSVSYIAVTGKDLDEATDRYYALLPRIDSLENVLPEGTALHGIRDFIPSRAMQRARIDRWNGYMAVHKGEIEAKVRSAAAAAGFADEAFAGFEAVLDGEYEVQSHDFFSVISENLASGYFIRDTGRCAVLTLLTSDTNCTSLVSGFLDGEDGVIVFDGSTLTGEMVRTLSNDFDKVLYICAFIVFALLLLSFGRVELALIAFLPLTIAWIWILGIMSLFGINFNIVNIILATFIFGMGDDYTIFITEGAMYEHTYGKKMLSTYKSTIILSALIMFIGIGALIVARHPALLSLAYVIMIGMFTVVLLAVTVPPFLYRWLTEKKGFKRREPVTLLNWLTTFAAFVVFLVSSLLLTVAGFFLITLSFGSKRGKSAYHRLLCITSRFIFRNVFFTRSHTETGSERFEKPAVIIANHQSHLDLMALLQLTPKMVVVTNRWVWNNPLYGLLIRYADFCPVGDFLEEDIAVLEKRVKEGFSVLIFPEGTRTRTGSIGRFHRGAFYLAEKLDMDIVPVVLHGLYDVLPKQSLLLAKGEMSVKVLGRIAPDNTSFGDGYRERTKSIRSYMTEEYEALAHRRETVDYFTNRVMHNYIYKGFEVSRAVRASLRDNASFLKLAENLPSGGRVLFENPLYGESSLICALVRKDVCIDAFIEDEMKRLLASNCEAVPQNLHYLQQRDAEAVYDAVIVFEDGVWRFKLESK